MNPTQQKAVGEQTKYRFFITLYKGDMDQKEFTAACRKVLQLATANGLTDKYSESLPRTESMEFTEPERFDVERFGKVLEAINIKMKYGRLYVDNT